ncbi:MAG: hypothetical protein QG608_10 [Actinomycetota bacterium]|nr:hypothetical protein [Actinomycetota bacterium]
MNDRALVRYHLLTVARTPRWAPPAVLLGVFVASANAGGPPAAGALAVAAVGLVPTGAWLSRVCCTAEDSTARDCVSASTGILRNHLAVLAAGLLAGLCALGLATLAVGAICVALGAEGLGATTLFAGITTELACLLMGLAVGALVSGATGRAQAIELLAIGLGVVLVLVLPFSPAVAAIGQLDSGSGTPGMPILALLGAVVMAAAATAASSALALRR